MERLGSVGFGSVLLVCLVSVSASFNKPFKLPQLCKFCDIESTTCNAIGICESSCYITAVCEDLDQVCVSAWRRSEGKTTIETVCHNPALPFHGQYLTDFNSSQCEMKQVKDDFYICSCNEKECNGRLIFTDDSPRDGQKKLLFLLLVSLVPTLIVAVLLVSLFYCYCVCQQKLKAPTTKGMDSETCAIIMSDDNRHQQPEPKMREICVCYRKK